MKPESGIQPWFVNRITGRGERFASVASAPEPPPRILDPSLARFSLAAWKLAFAGEARDTERPHDIRQALDERVPQAILRDLHRPVRPVPGIHLRAEAVGPAPSEISPRAAVHAAMATSYTVRMSDEPSARAMVAAAEAERRAIMDSPWEQARPAEPIAPASLFAPPEDAIWFGTEGGYDPDQ